MLGQRASLWKEVQRREELKRKQSSRELCEKAMGVLKKNRVTSKACTNFIRNREYFRLKAVMEAWTAEWQTSLKINAIHRMQRLSQGKKLLKLIQSN